MTHVASRTIVALAAVALVGCSGSIPSDETEDGDTGGEGGGSSAPRGGAGGSGGTAPNPRIDENPVATMSCPNKVYDPGQGIVRRLTHEELANTLDDVLGAKGADLDAAIAKLPSIKSGAFANDRDGLVVVDPALVAGYREVAAKALAAVGDLAAFGRKFTDCQTFTPACQDKYVRNLGERLFRRPLPDDRVARYTALFALAKAEGDDFHAGAGLVAQAMLQAPSFLYRIEGTRNGEPLSVDSAEGDGKVSVTAVDGYELATRLSYWLWASAPDEALLVAARTGELEKDDGLRKQVDRMLTDQRALRTVRGFASGWLHLSELSGLARDAKRYPDFGPELIADMKRETFALLESSWKDGSSITELFKAKTTKASPRLARLYGLQPQAAETHYELDRVPERYGLLTHASVLGVSGERDEPSMVLRGLYVYVGLLCRHIATPPVTVDATPVMPSEGGQTQRAAAEDRAKNAQCTACHGVFDPLAFAFEPYDGVGRYRTQDEFGNKLSSEGTLTTRIAPKETRFENVREMVDAFVEIPDLHTCIAQRAASFAFGETIGEDHACLFQDAVKAVNVGDGSLKDVVGAIATLPGFRYRRVD